MMKRVLTLILAVASSLAYSQNDEEEKGWQFSAGADLVSNYVWRGLSSSDKHISPHIQPMIGFDYLSEGKGTFSTYIWGTQSILDCYSELNFAIGYHLETKFGTFGIDIVDYFYPYLRTGFFNFKGKGDGSHTVEGMLSYSLPGKFPFQLIAATNIHNDTQGDNSFYMELSYPFEVGDFEFNLFTGAAKGVSDYYAVDKDGFKVINTGLSVSKELKISDAVNIPLGIDVIYNPFLKEPFFVLKASYFLP